MLSAVRQSLKISRNVKKDETRRTEGSENQKQTVMQIQGLAQCRQQPGALVFGPGTVGGDTVPMH